MSTVHLDQSDRKENKRFQKKKKKKKKNWGWGAPPPTPFLNLPLLRGKSGASPPPFFWTKVFLYVK